MSYDKFLRESSGMGPVPKAQGGVRGRRKQGRKGFADSDSAAKGKGKGHYPINTHTNTSTRPPTVTVTRSPRMSGRT